MSMGQWSGFLGHSPGHPGAKYWEVFQRVGRGQEGLGTDSVEIEVLFLMKPGRLEMVTLVLHIGSGDEEEAVGLLGPIRLLGPGPGDNPCLYDRSLHCAFCHVRFLLER